MILDTLDHAKEYAALGERLQRALEAMAQFSPDHYETGRVTLDGDNLYLLANSYETHGTEGALMEAHRQYADVMYMVEGEETIYVKPTDRLSNVHQPYDASGDALLAELDSDVTAVRLQAGSFLVLLPQDAHCPSCDAGTRQTVKKVIGKVRLPW